MVKAYINYPNPHVMLHASEECPTIQQKHKRGQRVVRLNLATLSVELEHFAKRDYRFGANPKTNDMWLYVEFNDSVFERAIVEYVRRILSEHYAPFARIKVDEHC